MTAQSKLTREWAWKAAPRAGMTAPRARHAEIKALAAHRLGTFARAQVLEVAPGPGFLTIELAKRGLHVRAVDISKTFVEIAKQTPLPRACKPALSWERRGLAVEDASVDFVVCRAAFKNFTEPVKALAEFRRVLRPAVKLC